LRLAALRVHEMGWLIGWSILQPTVSQSVCRGVVHSFGIAWLLGFNFFACLLLSFLSVTHPLWREDVFVIFIAVIPRSETRTTHSLTRLSHFRLFPVFLSPKDRVAQFPFRRLIRLARRYSNLPLHRANEMEAVQNTFIQGQNIQLYKVSFAWFTCTAQFYRTIISQQCEIFRHS
jgi:hypothetical protein